MAAYPSKGIVFYYVGQNYRQKPLIAYPTNAFRNRFQYLDFKEQRYRYVSTDRIVKILVPNVGMLKRTDYDVVRDYLINKITFNQFKMKIANRQVDSTSIMSLKNRIKELEAEVLRLERLNTILTNNHKAKPLSHSAITQTELSAECEWSNKTTCNIAETDCSTSSIITVPSPIEDLSTLDIKQFRHHTKQRNNEKVKDYLSSEGDQSIHYTEHQELETANNISNICKPSSLKMSRKERRRLKYQEVKIRPGLGFVPFVSATNSETELSPISTPRFNSVPSNFKPDYKEWHTKNIIKDVKPNIKLLSCLYKLSQCSNDIEMSYQDKICRIASFDVLLSNGINPFDENFDSKSIFLELHSKYPMPKIFLERVKFTLPDGINMEEAVRNLDLHFMCQH